MKSSYVFRLGIAFTTAAMFLACGLAAASDHGKDQGKGDHEKGHHDKLQADVAALKERVRRLEGNLTQAEVSGTYSLLLFQASLMEGATGNTSFLEHAVSGGTLQLNADHTLVYTGTELKFGSSWTMPAMRQETNRPDGFEGQWQYADGFLTVTVGAETLRFPGGVGGRLFATVTANFADGSTTQLLLIKNP